MERKLVKQGRNALTVTLPAHWLRDKGLSAGGSVFVQERNNDLVIATSVASKKSSVSVNLVGTERSMFFHVIIAKYIEGYDTIIATHDNPKVAQEICDQLMGMVIIEHTKTRTVYRSVIAVPEDNFDVMVRRAGHMLVQTARTVELIAQGKAEIGTILDEEHLLDFTLLFCLRYLNKYEDREHAYRYFLLCATFEQAGDHLKQLARNIGKDRKLAHLVGEAVDEYARLLFAGDLDKLYHSLRAFRRAIPSKTFADGIAYSLAETLYNYLGFLVGKKEQA